MRRIFFNLLVLTLGLTLFACGQGAEKQESSGQEEAVVVLKVSSLDQNFEQEVKIQKGDSVMEVLKKYLQVEEEGGMVTAIDGISQDADTSTYWMYKVNGELAEVGANDYKLKSGDQIAFYLESFD